MNTNNESINEPSPSPTIHTLEQAKLQINVVRGYLGQMGNNDSEFDQLNQIQEELDAGKINPDEAFRRANNLWTTKQMNF